MLIVWGKSLSRTPIGLVGHFCPFCRTLRVFDAIDVRQVEHLYFIPIGRGISVATELVCKTCQVPLGFQPGVVRPVEQAGSSVSELAARTSPLGEPGLVRRLQAEERLVSKTLSIEDRQELVEEPIRELEYFSSIQRDRVSNRGATSILVGLAIIGVIATLVMWYARLLVLPPTPTVVGLTNGVSIVAAILLVSAIAQTVAQRQRVSRSPDVLDPLARALRPLGPRLHELELALTARQAKGSSLAKGLRIPDIIAEIDRHASHLAG